ncbi:hypothetical protein NC653_038886 [Populus alba x Populus x berolinensis]|uniref:Uncharacterized protein n=1 Tax=Populus alba x Populus x berolinensis TaxID=444605 RepID=A0AAD6L9W5_9ROSI|nr:hypothetical protein NC653_038886 [Populus alba x Populus x berolinensis]
MKNYTIYAVSITIRIVFGFMFIALIWKFDFAPFMVLIIAILNDGTIMTISKDRVKPSPLPDSWKLKEIFSTGVCAWRLPGPNDSIILLDYERHRLLLSKNILQYHCQFVFPFIQILYMYMIFVTQDKFGVRSLRDSKYEMMAALYLQVSIVSQALIFVTRSRSWSFVERPGLLLVSAFVVAQLIATLIAVYANWGFAHIKGCGWGWAGVIWLFSLVTYLPLDPSQICNPLYLEWEGLDNFLENKTAFTTKKDYGKEEREAQWATAQRTLHGLQPAQTNTICPTRVVTGSFPRSQSKPSVGLRWQGKQAMLRELNTLKGHVESVVKLKGLDIDTIQQHYTL